MLGKGSVLDLEMEPVEVGATVDLGHMVGRTVVEVAEMLAELMYKKVAHVADCETEEACVESLQESRRRESSHPVAAGRPGIVEDMRYFVCYQWDWRKQMKRVLEGYRRWIADDAAHIRRVVAVGT